MANKRMFSLDIVDTDLFLEMPTSSQALYFQLGMRADDDGFVSSPKKIAKMSNCGEDDLRLLATKGYIIPFDSGVIVITHWRMNNNQIRSDRYKPSRYRDEMNLLELQGGAYQLSTNCLPNVYQMSDNAQAQNRIDKNRVDKNNNYSVHFESFWNAYPRKKEKAKAYKCYNARLNDGYSEEEMLTAAVEYANECRKRKTEERYIKLGATFLSASTPFVDYLNEKRDKDETEECRRPAEDKYREYLS